MFSINVSLQTNRKSVKSSEISHLINLFHINVLLCKKGRYVIFLPPIHLSLLTDLILQVAVQKIRAF